MSFDVMNAETMVLLAGAVIFILATTYFVIRGRAESFGPVPYLVTSTTILSYLLMVDGSFAGCADGEPVHAIRWFFYAGSCSLLMYSIARVLKKAPMQTMQMVYLNVLVMLGGGVAALLASPMKWLIFAAATLFFIFQLIVLYANTKPTPALSTITMYIAAGWCVFPVVFVLAPDGLGLISAAWAAACYLALDVFTKIIFYLHLKKV